MCRPQKAPPHPAPVDCLSDSTYALLSFYVSPRSTWLLISWSRLLFSGRLRALVALPASCVPAGFSAFWSCFCLGLGHVVVCCWARRLSAFLLASRRFGVASSDLGRALSAVGPVRCHAFLLFLEVGVLIRPTVRVGPVRFLHFFCSEWGAVSSWVWGVLLCLAGPVLHS